MNQTLSILSGEDPVVLIVSAHEHLQVYYAKELGRLGIQTLIARDAFEALDALRSELVHSVLTDYDLPGINALGFYLYARELHPSLPFVICCPDLSARRREEATQIGIRHLVKKSTLGQEVQNGVRKALEERELQILKFYC